MRAACSRAASAGVAAESATKKSVVKTFVFIAVERVDRQAAAETPKHLWPPVRLSRHGRLTGFHEVRARAQCWESGERRFHDVQFAKHCCCKDVHARIVLEQEFSDIAPTHVGCSAQSCLEISLTPVDGAVNQIWFFCQHRFHRGEIS